MENQKLTRSSYRKECDTKDVSHTEKGLLAYLHLLMNKIPLLEIWRNPLGTIYVTQS